MPMAGGHSGRRVQYAALPYRVRRDGEVQIRLITSRETRRWVIPKGWPMKGLSPPKAAARECYEEAGLMGVISREPLGMYTYEKRLGTRSVLCDVLVFPLKVKRLLQKWPERFQRHGFWFSVDSAAGAVQEEELAQLISSFGDMMARKHEAKLRAAEEKAQKEKPARKEPAKEAVKKGALGDAPAPVAAGDEHRAGAPAGAFAARPPKAKVSKDKPGDAPAEGAAAEKARKSTKAKGTKDEKLKGTKVKDPGTESGKQEKRIKPAKGAKAEKKAPPAEVSEPQGQAAALAVKAKKAAPVPKAKAGKGKAKDIPAPAPDEAPQAVPPSFGTDPAASGVKGRRAVAAKPASGKPAGAKLPLKAAKAGSGKPATARPSAVKAPTAKSPLAKPVAARPAATKAAAMKPAATKPAAGKVAAPKPKAGVKPATPRARRRIPKAPAGRR